MIFEWVKKQWDEDPPLDGWEGFHSRKKALFGAQFPGRQLVSPERRVAANLAFLLDQTRGLEPRHVLLYFYRSETAPIQHRSQVGRVGASCSLRCRPGPILRYPRA